MSSLLEHRRSLRKLWPVLALSALTMLQPASVSLGAGTGRDFARCVVECNSARRECRRSCRSSCGNDFFRGRGANKACKNACYEECNEIRQTCRENCKVIKPPPSGSIP